jgi:hypothetical protein
MYYFAEWRLISQREREQRAHIFKMSGKVVDINTIIENFKQKECLRERQNRDSLESECKVANNLFTGCLLYYFLVHVLFA